MGSGGMGELVAAVQHELLLFAGVFFLILAVDELLVDLIWFCHRAVRAFAGGRDGMPDRFRPPRAGGAPSLAGPAAVLLPAWREEKVLATTIAHMLAAWPHRNLSIYVGCYPNDPATKAAALAGAAGDGRVLIVTLKAGGPTSKPDCLNELYRALEKDERQSGSAARMVVLHDAEDMVDPAALDLLDAAIGRAAFVQLPVLALPRPDSRWVAGHYSDEFAESHAKTMVVRDLLGAGLPGAGVGSAIARPALARLAKLGHGRPFADVALTEDYELGLKIAAMGGRQRFLRCRTADGRLIATRSYFPARLMAAVRQKTRWTQGIALQGWDRIGWHGSLLARWMQLRDRRGPFAALLTAIAYLLIVVFGASWLASRLGFGLTLTLDPVLEALLLANLAFLAWRAVMRGMFTAREFGLAEGLRAIARIPVGNVIHIMAGRRAVWAYWQSLWGEPTAWDKTEHTHHPAPSAAPRKLAA